MPHPFILGIAGGSGSGKTTIVERLLASRFADQISLLSHDAYYLNSDHMPEEIRRSHNWDHPEALDNELFLQHIDELTAGHAVEQPVYDFATHSRTVETDPVHSRPILLIEGLLLFAIPHIRDRLHLCVYVDTPPDLRIVRRMVRDITERGRTVESVSAQYQTTVRPMHERFVEPSKDYAHIIVPWLFYNDQAVELLLARIAAALPAA
jgi:uridine kinase